MASLTRSSPDDSKRRSSWLVTLLSMAAVVLVLVTLTLRGRRRRSSCMFVAATQTTECNTRVLDEIPLDVPLQSLSLHIVPPPGAQNNFRSLAAANVSRFRRLNDLELTRCGIDEILPLTFSDATTVRRLELAQNRIRKLNELTFRGLAALEYLGLSGNPIRSLGNHVFRGMQIGKLQLEDMASLHSIAPLAFQGALVRELRISSSSIQSLPDDALSYLRGSLESISLTGNVFPLRLSSICLGELRLRRLDLRNSGLVDVAMLASLASVEELRLDDNPLLEFDAEKFAALQTTRRLSLRNIQLRSVSLSQLSQLVNVHTLDLSHNQLVTFNATVFSRMAHLTSLDLSENQLDDYDGNLSHVFPSLKLLLLHQNRFNTLPVELSPLFSRLSNLTLHQNPLHCNCEIRWFLRWLDSRDRLFSSHPDLACATPEVVNLTKVNDYGFRCRPPVIVNTSLLKDGTGLECVAEGDPPPELSWLTPAGTIPTSQHRKHTRGSLRSTGSLIVSRHGNYTCVALSLAGEDRVTVDTSSLSFSGKALPTEKIKILHTFPGLVLVTVLLCFYGYLVTR